MDLRRLCSSPRKQSGVSYVIATKRGRRVCAGSEILVVDLEFIATRAGPHDDGTVRTSETPRGSEVGEHSTEELTIKYHACDEALRRNAERARNSR